MQPVDMVAQQSSDNSNGRTRKSTVFVFAGKAGLANHFDALIILSPFSILSNLKGASFTVYVRDYRGLMGCTRNQDIGTHGRAKCFVQLFLIILPR